MTILKIGVLDLQGAVAEHLRMLRKVGVEPVNVKKTDQLHDLSGLIIPGGESTTIGKLMNDHGFTKKLIEKSAQGFPIWGTCAGMIVLAGRIQDRAKVHLGLMNMLVRRNAFGRQRESFETNLVIRHVADDFRAVFIRAPLVEEVGEKVDVLSYYRNEVVAVREEHLLATSFHPELTDDERFHAYFAKMARQYESEMPTIS